MFDDGNDYGMIILKLERESKEYDVNGNIL
jgi:hypothetical protein